MRAASAESTTGTTSEGSEVAPGFENADAAPAAKLDLRCEQFLIA